MLWDEEAELLVVLPAVSVDSPVYVDLSAVFAVVVSVGVASVLGLDVVVVAMRAAQTLHLLTRHSNWMMMTTIGKMKEIRNQIMTLLLLLQREAKILVERRAAWTLKEKEKTAQENYNCCNNYCKYVW